MRRREGGSVRAWCARSCSLFSLPPIFLLRLTSGGSWMSQTGVVGVAGAQAGRATGSKPGPGS